jgi:hypothetical protein
MRVICVEPEGEIPKANDQVSTINKGLSKVETCPKAFVECGGKGRPIGDGDGEKVPKNSNMSSREGIVPSRGLCILIIGASRGKRIQVRKKSVNPMR